MFFYDRHDAGRQLAEQLKKYKGQKDAIVLGLARGGVVTAYEVAKLLSLPLNAIVPKKIGAPGNPELAIGAIMENGEAVFNDSIIRMLGIPQNYIERTTKEKQIQAQERAALYRRYAPLPTIKGHTVILVDDGIATGATMLASVKGMRKEEAKHIVVAVPVASTDSLLLIEKMADEVVCLDSEEDFGAVGFFYQNFSQTEDEEVIKLLKLKAD
ncbi:MAG: phosphoribosyltransferase [Chlamydiales bacterium]